jgi:hypothetical protein
MCVVSLLWSGWAGIARADDEKAVIAVVDANDKVLGAWSENYQQVTSTAGEVVLQAGKEVVFVFLQPVDHTGRTAVPQDVSLVSAVLYHRAVDCSDTRLMPQTGLILAPVPANDWSGILFFPDNTADPISSADIYAKEILAPGQDFNQAGSCVPIGPGTAPTMLPVKTYSIKKFSPPFRLEVR